MGWSPNLFAPLCSVGNTLILNSPTTSMRKSYIGKLCFFGHFRLVMKHNPTFAFTSLVCDFSGSSAELVGRYST